jgi:hypothetical protein
MGTGRLGCRRPLALSRCPAPPLAALQSCPIQSKGVKLPHPPQSISPFSHKALQNGMCLLLPTNNAFRANVHGISGLVVEYIVAIDVTRVQFPADAIYHLSSGKVVWPASPRPMVDSLPADSWFIDALALCATITHDWWHLWNCGGADIMPHTLLGSIQIVAQPPSGTGTHHGPSAMPGARAAQAFALRIIDFGNAPRTLWPSGLRRQTQVLVERSAWVRTPQVSFSSPCIACSPCLDPRLPHFTQHGLPDGPVVVALAWWHAAWCPTPALAMPRINATPPASRPLRKHVHFY